MNVIDVAKILKESSIISDFQYINLYGSGIESQIAYIGDSGFNFKISFNDGNIALGLYDLYSFDRAPVSAVDVLDEFQDFYPKELFEGFAEVFVMLGYIDKPIKLENPGLKTIRHLFDDSK